MPFSSHLYVTIRVQQLSTLLRAINADKAARLGMLACHYTLSDVFDEKGRIFQSRFTWHGFGSPSTGIAAVVCLRHYASPHREECIPPPESLGSEVKSIHPERKYSWAQKCGVSQVYARSTAVVDPPFDGLGSLSPPLFVSEPGYVNASCGCGTHRNQRLCSFSVHLPYARPPCNQSRLHLWWIT